MQIRNTVTKAHVVDSKYKFDTYLLPTLERRGFIIKVTNILNGDAIILARGYFVILLMPILRYR